MRRLHVPPGWGIAILRIIVGLVFLEHGNQKLFTYGLGGVAESFAKMGMPAPGFSAALVTFVEFLGGLGLIFGLLTRWASLLLSIVMLVAVFGVHLKGGFFLPAGFEYALTLLAANLCLVIAGPGSFALDRMIGRGRASSPASEAKKAV